MTSSFRIRPIGRVKKAAGRQMVEVETGYQAALLGLEQYSHVWIIYWFHENDDGEDRHILQVHPMRNPANPLTGVFATRSPVRPNLIGLCAVRLLGVEGGTVWVEGLDARDGAPVLDIKPYMQKSDALPEATGPELLPQRGAD